MFWCSGSKCGLNCFSEKCYTHTHIHRSKSAAINILKFLRSNRFHTIFIPWSTNVEYMNCCGARCLQLLNSIYLCVDCVRQLEWMQNKFIMHLVRRGKKKHVWQRRWIMATLAYTVIHGSNIEQHLSICILININFYLHCELDRPILVWNRGKYLLCSFLQLMSICITSYQC